MQQIRQLYRLPSAKTVPQGEKILGIAGIKGKAVVLKSDSGKPTRFRTWDQRTY
jgi:hypothetical protein